MPHQVHAVMQKTKHVNHMAIAGASHPKQNKMPPIAPIAPITRDMKRPDVATDFWPLLDSDH